MNKTRIGIIACSSVAEKRFIPALKLSDQAILSMIGSRTIKKARLFAKRHGTEYYGDYQDVIHSPDVDCVYISTPPALHEELAILAAKNKKHIICEKPALLNLKSLKKVLEVCKKNKVKFFENYMYQFHDQHDYIKNWLKSENKPLLLSIKYLVPKPPIGNYRYKLELGGGAFYDMYGYAVSLILYLFDSFPKTVSTVFQMDKKYKIPTSVSSVIKYDEYPIVNVMVGYGIFYTNQYSITTENHEIRCNKAFAIDNSYEPDIEILNDDGITSPKLNPQDQFLTMINKFCEAIQNTANTGFEDYNNLTKQYMVMDAALRSWKDSRSIVIS